MKTIFYILSLLAIVAGIASAFWKRWDRAAFFVSIAIWLTQ